MCQPSIERSHPGLLHFGLLFSLTAIVAIGPWMMLGTTGWGIAVPTGLAILLIAALEGAFILSRATRKTDAIEVASAATVQAVAT